MGQTVTCACGQRNSLDSYEVGETRVCVACGRLLSDHPEREYMEEGFAAAPGAFEEEPGASQPTGFETPTEHVESPDAPPVARTWQDGVREAAAPVETDRCARCNRPFRGDWDRNPRPEGAVCHVCAVQADQAYKPPDIRTRRELYRPQPPKPQGPPAAGSSEEEERARKKREMLVLGGIAVVTLVLVNVLPVETWVAMLFSADPEKAAGLAAGWNWAVRIANFVTSAAGSMITLYVALAWTRLLHEGGWRANLPSLLYLGIAFALMNLFVSFIHGYAGMVFGPLAIALVGLAFVVTLMIKLLMISSQFHLRMEAGVGFVLCWAFAGILMTPCVFAVHRLVHGVVAAIAL